MNMTNAMEAIMGAADAQHEVVGTHYEKSGAFIGGMAGAMVGGVAGLVLGGITGAVTGGNGAFSGALRGAMTGVLSGVVLGGIGGALIERKPDEKSVYQLIGDKIQLKQDDAPDSATELDETAAESDQDD